MNFMKKIFEGKVDEDVHRRFTRFSKGIFEGRAVCKIRAGSKIKISTSFEYVNDLVDFFFSLSDKMQADGKIFLREDMDLEELGVKGGKKKKKGGFEIQVDQELTKEQISKLRDNVYFLLLNLHFDGGELKIKQSLPGRGGGKKGKVNDKFCVAILDAKYLEKVREEFFFDVKECKSASVEHTFEIKEIILPEEIKDYELARLQAKRKGKVIRKLIVDGKEKTIEREFVV